MKSLRVFLLRLWAVLRSPQMDRDMNNEIASHLAEATDDYIKRGLSPEDARLAALRSFGGVVQTRFTDVDRHCPQDCVRDDADRSRRVWRRRLDPCGRGGSRRLGAGPSRISG